MNHMKIKIQLNIKYPIINTEYTLNIYIIFMNKQYLVTVLLTAAAAWTLYNQQTAQKPYTFDQFKNDYRKQYGKAGEQQYRKAIYLRNLVKIAEHNSNPQNTYKLSVNQFADLTEAEFQALYLTLKVPTKHVKIMNEHISPVTDTIDWEASGKVSHIKNQQACGSCWAFSTIAAIESAVRIKNGQDSYYSEQELVDCSGPEGNHGCNGGWMDSAFEYIISKGIASENDYAYVARDQDCKQVTGKKLKITSYVDVQGCDNLLNALKERPISVAVDASNWSLYGGGIMSNCGTGVNHGVLLVGVTDTYWRIKNSWGTGWGEKGFIRIGPGDTCAICQYPSYPIL